MTRPLLKIYGERNTGTNYLQRLVDRNLDVVLLPGTVPDFVEVLQRIFPGKEFMRDLYFRLTFPQNLGWKHSLVKPSEELATLSLCTTQRVVFVTLTKNPYSWALSLYRHPYHYRSRKLSIEAFLQHPWKTVGRENGPLEFLTPIDMWNQKNLSYIRLNERFTALNLRYEDLLADPETLIEKIATHFSIQHKHDAFIKVNSSTKNDYNDFLYYHDYYLNERWRNDMPQHGIEIISSQLSDNVISYCGYEKLA